MRNDYGGLVGKHRRLYRAWYGMHARCSNPKHAAYRDYGGRGVCVSPLWADLEPFIEWALASGYSDVLTLDRIDNNGGYSPANCRWATMTVQSRNRRNSIKLERNGEERCVAEWCEIEGVPQELVRRRLRNGWELETAFSTPAAPKDAYLTANGRTQRVSEWAAETGMPVYNINQRIRRGWTPERCVAVEAGHRRRKPTPIEIDGEWRTIPEWCARLGISDVTLQKRRRNGVYRHGATA